MDGASLPAFCPVKSCKHSAALMASFSTIHITTFSAILGTTFPHPIALKLEFLPMELACMLQTLPLMFPWFHHLF